jgi:hypothetical protein
VKRTAIFPIALAAALSLPSCAAPHQNTAPTAAAAPATTVAATPTPSATPPGDKDLKAALILKAAADTYRQELAEGHGYKRAGSTDHYDAWWSYLTQGAFTPGLLVDTARRAYNDAGDLYGQDAYPAALDDWDDLMDGHGPFYTHAYLWHDRGNEAEYQATLNTLDEADRLADQLHPGAKYQPTPVPPLVVDP